MKSLKAYFILLSEFRFKNKHYGLFELQRWVYLFKEITLQDITKLNEIAITTEIGNCIRFKMDDENFESAEIVEDCCCNLFN